MTSTHFAEQSRGSTQLKTVKRLLIMQLAAYSTLYKQVRSEICWTTKSNAGRQMCNFTNVGVRVGLSPRFYYARDRKQRFCFSFSCLMSTNSLNESLLKYSLKQIICNSPTARQHHVYNSLSRNDRIASHDVGKTRCQ